MAGKWMEIQIKGMKEIDKKLALIRKTTDVKTGGVIMRGLRRGAAVVRQEAKRRAPVLQDNKAWAARDLRRFHKAGYRLEKLANRVIPENLRDNIVVQMVAARKNPRGVPAVWVRVRTKNYIFGPQGRRNLIGNPNYWWLVEFGTEKTRAQPFLRPAFEAKKQQAAEVARDAILREIDMIMKGKGPRVR